MAPSPPGNGKRKAGEEPGPAQKRPRKDGPVSNKRKLREGELKSQSHGLVFRRDVSSQPSSQPTPAPNAERSSSPPPSKKPKTGPAPSPAPTAARAGSSTKGKGKARDLPAVVEDQEREEDDEGEGAVAEHGNGERSARRASTYGGMVTDLQQPLEPRETPRIEANRSFRGEQPVAGPSTPKRQRRSSQSKGKRASMGAESGIVTTPHRSVEGQHFYHHIDPEMSEAARMSLLLQWSYKRQLVSATPSGKDPPETALLRECVDTLVRELAEKKIDVSGAGGPQYDRWRGKTFDANEQNQKNRLRHANFSEDIRRAQAEDSAWVKAAKFYNELRARHDEDEKAMQAKGKRRSEADMLPDVNLAPPGMRAGIQNVLNVLANRDELPAPDPRLARAKFEAENHRRNIQAALRVAQTVDDDLHGRFAQLWTAMSEPQHLPARLPPVEVSRAFADPPWARCGDDMVEQLRALSVADEQLPPARDDAAAREAARQAERAAQAGPSARPITQAPPPTPRRPHTPARR